MAKVITVTEACFDMLSLVYFGDYQSHTETYSNIDFKKVIHSVQTCCIGIYK